MKTNKQTNKYINQPSTTQPHTESTSSNQVINLPRIEDLQ